MMTRNAPVRFSLPLPALAATCVLSGAALLAGCSASLGPDTDGRGGQANASAGGTEGGTSSGGGMGTPHNTGGGSQVVSTEDGLELDGAPEYYRVVRLTHDQWENAVRDLLELEEAPGYADNFIPDPPNGTFSNNERALYVTSGLRLDYQRAAEDLAEKMVENGSLTEKWGNTAAEVIETLGRRAFRRKLTQDEVDRYTELWQEGSRYYSSGDDVADGARIFLEALLQSPHFLYRLELSPDGGRLSGNELATKLSFVLKNTIPSDEILDAAQSGTLDDDAGLRAVAREMLEEEDAILAMEQFHDELFGLSRYRSILKSTETFPSYTEELNQVLYAADVEFFSDIYQRDGGIRSILTSTMAYVSEELAPYYGISVSGSQLKRVELEETRPGFLTRVGFLAYNANLSDPDPIHRGVDINNRLLCAHLSPPAGEIPPLPAPEPGQTNRERVSAHTSAGVCGNCHETIINPPGFALEGFDAMGQERTMDNGKPIDTSGMHELLGMEPFDGIVDLTTMMAENSRVHACYASHILKYALSRDLGEGDVDLLESMSATSKSDNASIKELLLAAVTSPRFTHVSVKP